MEAERAGRGRGWAAEFERLCERIGARFTRPEVRRRAAGFLRGLLGGIDRKNGWQLAEHTSETTPDGMQRLLTTTRWDPHALRDDVRGYVVEQLGDPGGVVDRELYLPKEGAADVARRAEAHVPALRPSRSWPSRCWHARWTLACRPDG